MRATPAGASLATGCLRLLAACAVLAALTCGIARTAHASGPNSIVQVPAANGTDSCKENFLPENDDGSTGFVPVPFPIDFFGNTYTGLYVNNNGNVTFDQPLGTYTPFGLIAASTPIIAPFFADVWTYGTDPVTYSWGDGLYGTNRAFCVNWVEVGYFVGTDKLNSFQLLLVERPDTGAGNFDIVFNYDKITWETGSASGGSGGLGGASARAGFSNGTTTSFELPGSAVNGAFLDSNLVTGLIANNIDAPLQPGRYVFPVRNGAVPTGQAISGHVWLSTSGNPAAHAFLQLCHVPLDRPCRTGTADSAGAYSMGGLGDGTWSLRVFPPAGSGATTGSLPAIVVNGADVAGQDVTLTAPIPIPAGTTLTPSNGAAVPGVFWSNPLTVATHGCPGGTASATIVAADGYTETIILTGDASGLYEGTFAALSPHSGLARVTITIYCGYGTPSEIVFDLYIDPSGVVVSTLGHPVVGATVTLSRSDTPGGPFATVPNGSAIMSPGNRRNPDLSVAGGRFGWDTLAGYYQVRAARAGCGSATTAVLEIPPPVTDLVLTLTCPAADLDALKAMIEGMGLDLAIEKELTTKARDAAALATAGNGPGACLRIDDLIEKAIAKTGKTQPRLAIAQAKQIVADANAIEALLGCATLAAAEAAVLDLIGSINELGTSGAPWTDLRTDAQSSGRQLAHGQRTTACATLAKLDTTAAKKLTAAVYGSLAPAIQGARSAAVC